MSRPRIVVVGDLVTDVVAHLSGPPVPGSDRAATISVGGGGAGGNVAAWLAAAGADAQLVARVGDDDRGRGQVAALEAAGVTCHVAVDPSRATGTVVVLVDADGERTMLPDRAANAALHPDDLPAALLSTGAHLHLSGYPLLDAVSRPAALEVLRRAREHGVGISVDTSSTGPLAAAGGEAFLAWTADVACRRANLDEARMLTGLAAPEAAARALGATCAEAVVTAGAAGSWWSDGERVVHRPATATTVRDTTGAGDAFTAGYLRARLAGADPGDALAVGAELAGRAVAATGARPAPARATTDATDLT